MNLFSPFPTVPGLWHSAAVRQQALHHKSRGIHLCHAQHLPGHHLPVQLPPTDHGTRPWLTPRVLVCACAAPSKLTLIRYSTYVLTWQVWGYFLCRVFNSIPVVCHKLHQPNAWLWLLSVAQGSAAAPPSYHECGNSHNADNRIRTVTVILK